MGQKENSASEIIGRWYKENINKTKYYCYGLTKHNECADDLAHKTYEKAFKDLMERAINVKSPFAWLKKIAYYLYVDKIRGKKDTLRHATSIEQIVPINLVSAELTPEQKLLAKEKVSLLKSAIGLVLSERERNHLKCYLNGGHKEASEKMNISKGCSKVMLCKYRKKLRDCMDKLDNKVK